MSTREAKVMTGLGVGVFHNIYCSNLRPLWGRGDFLPKIRQSDYDQIRAEAERSYPHECCGILLGSISDAGRTVTLTIACDNTSHNAPERRYSIDPRQVIAAMKLARTRGENIIGFYHSHPDHPAQPSATDLAEAHWMDCSYVIIGVQQGRATDTNAFVLRGSEDNKHFEPEEIQVHPPHAPGKIEI
jgi:proteasome lid subunit RPN8/RPN11